mgnify:CR=1 FL=1
MPRSDERVQLYPHQRKAIDTLHSGCILCGGVGTGKSITSIGYFYEKECGGTILPDGSLVPPPSFPELIIITTARKRDTHEWDAELTRFGVSAIVDSWNNIGKYVNGHDGAFYIFDEQRVVGSGAWVKFFILITQKHHWILLTATPGDSWMDYIPVFIANGFYKNRTQFLRRHAVYNRYSKYPKVDRYVECGHLERLRRQITVLMKYDKKTVCHYANIPAEYDEELYSRVVRDRVNPYLDKPIKNISEVCYLMRKVVNSDPTRIDRIRALQKETPRLIIFYNYDYELEMLRGLDGPIAEWNGHKHEPIPDTERWVYLVQYTSGAEGWNCVSTDTVVFFSQSYSHKAMVQAAGRIDRLNTLYTDLYYYTLVSKASIDRAIAKCLKNKEDFNEQMFLSSRGAQ